MHITQPLRVNYQRWGCTKWIFCLLLSAEQFFTQWKGCVTVYMPKPTYIVAISLCFCSDTVQINRDGGKWSPFVRIHLFFVMTNDWVFFLTFISSQNFPSFNTQQAILFASVWFNEYKNHLFTTQDWKEEWEELSHKENLNRWINIHKGQNWRMQEIS